MTPRSRRRPRAAGIGCLPQGQPDAARRVGLAQGILFNHRVSHPTSALSYIQPPPTPTPSLPPAVSFPHERSRPWESVSPCRRRRCRRRNRRRRPSRSRPPPATGCPAPPPRGTCPQPPGHAPPTSLYPNHHAAPITRRCCGPQPPTPGPSLARPTPLLPNRPALPRPL